MSSRRCSRHPLSFLFPLSFTSSSSNVRWVGAALLGAALLSATVLLGTAPLSAAPLHPLATDATTPRATCPPADDVEGAGAGKDTSDTKTRDTNTSDMDTSGAELDPAWQRRLEPIAALILDGSEPSLRQAQRRAQRLLQRLVEAPDGGAAQRPAAATAAAWLALARAPTEVPVREHHEGHSAEHHEESSMPPGHGSPASATEDHNHDGAWLWQAAWALDADAAAAVAARVTAAATAVPKLPEALLERARQRPRIPGEGPTPISRNPEESAADQRPPVPVAAPWESSWGLPPEAAFDLAVPPLHRFEHRPFALEAVPLDLWVDADGSVRDLTLMQDPCGVPPSPRSLLATFDVASRWTFRPALDGDQPIAGRLGLHYAATPLALATAVTRDRYSLPLHGALLEERWQDAEVAATARLEGQRTCAARSATPCDLWRTYALRALARTAAAGDPLAGRGDWGRARAFAPSPLVDFADIDAYGPAARELSRLRARMVMDEERAVDATPPPIPLASPHWVPPSEPLAAETVRATVLVDGGGLPYAPRVTSARSPAQADAALRALDSWRFPPDPSGIPRRLTVELEPREPDVPVETGAPGGPLEDPAPLAVLIQFDAAQRPAHEALLRGGRAPAMALTDHSAATLALHALASAGLAAEAQRAGRDDAELGVRFAHCLWRSAQRLYPALANSDLSAYGAAGEVLDPAWLDLPTPWRRPHLPDYGYLLPGDEVPQRQAWVEPELSQDAREAGLRGQVKVLTFLDADGWVTSTRVLQGIILDGTLSAVRALCRSRYQPAQRGNVTIPVEFVETVAVGATTDAVGTDDAGPSGAEPRTSR